MVRSVGGGVSMMVLALALSGCAMQPAELDDPRASRPIAVDYPDGPPPRPLPVPSAADVPQADAPPPQIDRTLPPAVSGADAYAWIDRADRLWEIIGDSPPDFAFDYGDTELWAWTTGEGYWVITEPLDRDDAVNGYYYRPGSLDAFLVRTPDRSFGFQDGRLAVVYDRDGRRVPGPTMAADADAAARLYLRARQLREAAASAQRLAVDPDDWSYAAPLFLNFGAEWDTGLRYEPLWNEYRSRPSIERWWRAIEIERQRRRQRAADYWRWRAGGYVGVPPVGIDRPGQHRRPGGKGGWHRPGAGAPPARPGGRPGPGPGAPPSHAGGQPGSGGGKAPPAVDRKDPVPPPGSATDRRVPPGAHPPGWKGRPGMDGMSDDGKVAPRPVDRPGRPPRPTGADNGLGGPAPAPLPLPAPKPGGAPQPAPKPAPSAAPVPPPVSGGDRRAMPRSVGAAPLGDRPVVSARPPVAPPPAASPPPAPRPVVSAPPPAPRPVVSAPPPAPRPAASAPPPPPKASRGDRLSSGRPDADNQ